MKDMLCGSVFFGAVISIAAYEVGVLLKKKFKLAVFNPLLISIILVIAFLLLSGVDYESYNEGAKYISYLLTPATVCLAVPLYKRLGILKDNWAAIAAGTVSGVVASAAMVLALCAVMGLSHTQYVTLLPKSITTAIGIELSSELGGNPSITAAVIVITGVVGNVTASGVCRVFHIQEPVAVGAAIGTASHAIGTARAMEIGEIEGAVSSLAIVVSGILTVAAAGLFSLIW